MGVQNEKTRGKNIGTSSVCWNWEGKHERMPDLHLTLVIEEETRRWEVNGFKDRPFSNPTAVL